jgi:hypothetical protein
MLASMSTALVIVIPAALVTLVALVIVRPTEVDLAARGLRVRRRAGQPRRDRDRAG